MKLRFGIIYKITNLVNKKIYIGQTIHSLTHRFNQHNNKAGCTKLHAALKKYGRENFIIEEIEKVPIDKLDEREIYWISFYKSTDRSIGYNILPGGKLGPLGKRKLNDSETKELILLDSKGVSHTLIGQKFGIDRKTVTLILRREDAYQAKYLRMNERTDLEDLKNYLLNCNPTVTEVLHLYKISRSTLFKYTKSIGYKFLSYRERQKLEYNSSTSVRTLTDNAEG